jgi:hypothetical protein
VGTTGVAAYLREFKGERLMILNNLTDENQIIRLPFDLSPSAIDILNNDSIPSTSQPLKPYQYNWIKL